MDDLDNLKEEIRSYAEEKGIKFLDAHVNISKNSGSDIFVEKDVEWKTFIDFISNYKDSLIISTESKLEEEEDYGIDGDLEVLKENPEFLPLIKNFESLVGNGNGKVYSVSISWIYQGKIMTKFVETDWFAEIIKAVDEINVKYLLYRDESKKYCEICSKELDDFTLESIDEGDSLRCGMCKRTLNEKEREELEKESDRIAEEISKEEIFASAKINLQKLYVEKKYTHIPKSKVAYIIDRARALIEASKKNIIFD